MSNDKDDRVILLERYNVIRKDQSREEGGVALYYRDHLNVKERKDLNPEKIEAICLEIFKPKSKATFVTNLYRSPNFRSEVLYVTKQLVENLDAENKETILVGDFNCDLQRIISPP